MGMFVGEGAPLIWRGPMLTKALTQFLQDVEWGDLDYLLIDLPPGTGDVQMTLTMQFALDGGVIVTTPQDVALADVERGIRMFQQAHAPVIGVVENMSYHVCPSAAATVALFGEGGGERTAAAHAVPFLGGIPLVKSVREAGDSGRPVVSADPEGEVAIGVRRDRQTRRGRATGSRRWAMPEAVADAHRCEAGAARRQSVTSSRSRAARAESASRRWR